MQIEYDDLKAATQARLITNEQAQQLWAFWERQRERSPQFRFSHVLYYFGGLLAISAITLFVTQAWETLRGFPLFLITTLLFILGCLFARYFLQRKLFIPAGIMATFSLVLVPLAVYNIQITLGLLPPPQYYAADYHYFINGYWVPMELTTLLAGAVMLYIYDFPFLLFPVAVTLWYLSMDLYSLLFNTYDFSSRANFSIVFGLLVIASAIYFDFKYDDRRDYPFWLYIVGVVVFWGGLTCQHSDSEITKFIYCMINILLIICSVFLNRRVFAIFGALGVLGYLGHLAFSIFADSLGFPLVLVFLGIGIILAATRWPAAEAKLVSYLHPYIPKKILRRMETPSLHE